MITPSCCYCCCSVPLCVRVCRYLALCNTRLSALIQLVLGQLTSGDRCKIISLITLDVHARDVVQKLIDEKTEGGSIQGRAASQPAADSRRGVRGATAWGRQAPDVD